MNRRAQNISHAERGSALLAALCFCAVLGIALASYMAVCSQTMQLSNRNCQGTHSLELAETGMEEAIWALNNASTDSWAGWTIDNGSSPKTATKTEGGFSFGNGVTGTAVLTVENYDGSSVAPDYAGGLVKLKVTGQTTLGDGSTVTRKLQASAQKAPLFVNAIASLATSGGSDGGNQVKDGISFTDWASVDSVDSADLTSPPPGFSAVVSSASSIGLTNASIQGYVTVSATQNGDPRISYSSGVHVAGPSTSMSAAIDPSRISTSPYQPVFTIKNPTAGSPYPSGVDQLELGNPSDTAPAVYFVSGDLVLLSGQTLTINGPVALVISGNLKIEDTGKLIITPQTVDGSGLPVGAGSLQVFLIGSTSELSIRGDHGGGIKNLTKIPKAVAIFDEAVSPYNDPEIVTTENFYGVVYAPKSTLTINSPADDFNFYGSIVAKNVNISGTPSFHYDVDLRRVTSKFSGIETPFVVSGWQETSP